MESILLQLEDALLPPPDGPATSNGAGIRAMGTTITSAGKPPSTGGNSKIIVLLDDNINTAVDGIVVQVPSSDT